MFFIVALFCIASLSGGSQAVPLLHPSSSNSTNVPALFPSTSTDQRSTSDIIWSCLATIFACTWVSVHPNMPGPEDGQLRIALVRLELMLWAIVAPEMIVLWAMRQWQGARMLLGTFGKHGWTMTHTHFLQMGGFMLAEGNKDICVLFPYEFQRLLSRKEIGFPLISEQEIQDRSKGDGLSKALVVCQTSWFIAQCISRKAQGLEITEIELVTVAFALFNGMTYFLWWRKPVDVKCCVRIYLLAGSIPNPQTIDIPPPNTGDHLLSTPETESGNRVSPEDSVIRSGPPMPWRSPVTYILFVFHRLQAIQGWSALKRHEQQIGTRIPIFFAYDISQNFNALYRRFGREVAVSALSVVFGAIHCTGWFLVFPSRPEQMLWRVSSVLISCIPVLVIFRHSVGLIVLSRRYYSSWTDTLARVFWLPFIALIPVYIMARLALLVEASISLRNLPPGAYAVVSWIRYIPHI